MIVLTAVVPRDAVPLDTALARRDVGPVTLLYEERSEAPAQERSAVLEYGRRIVALAEKVPLLPMRYGTTVSDTDELFEIAGASADKWSRRLAYLDGRCELVVHLDLDDGHLSKVPVDSGRAYLEARIAQTRARERVVAGARRALDPWAVETRLLPDQRRLAVLVGRNDADAAREGLAHWAEGAPEVAVTTSGPWPPFSFCEEEPS